MALEISTSISIADENKENIRHVWISEKTGIVGEWELSIELRLTSQPFCLNIEVKPWSVVAVH